MSSESKYDDFQFIIKTGKRISAMINADPKNEEWVKRIIEEQYSTGDYPSDTLALVKSAIRSNDELSSNFSGIVMENEDNIPTLYNAIFLQDEEEEDYGNMANEEDELFIEEEDIKSPEQTLDIKGLAQRQQKQIENIKNTLCVSVDVAYLLLKHFDWNSDKAIAQFIDNREKVMNDLHLKEENLHGELLLKNVGKGECQICFNDNVDLYKLYCGHALCKECWQGEIESQLSQGASTIVCRIDNCYSEIMIKDIERFCGEDKAETFRKFVLEDQISRDYKLIHCTNPNCQRVITINSVGKCHVATCKCGKRICWRCLRDAHAPLSCQQLKRWNKIFDEMQKLSRDQTRWEAREHKLVDYRRAHIKEVQTVFDCEYKKMQAQYKSIDQNELDEIEKIKKQIISCSDEKLKSQYEIKLREKENENKIKSAGRLEELNSVKQEQDNFISAIQNPRYAQFYMHQMKESQNLRAFAQFCNTDEEYIERMTKKCPKCKVPISKISGCNYMKCGKCNFEFCWVCGADWKTHGDHFVCNKYDTNNDNFEGDDLKDDDVTFDPHDKKFYPPPMNSEQRAQFARWNHYFRRYQGHIDTHKMEVKIRDKCRKILMESWSCCMSEKTADQFINKIYSIIDLSRSILIYSYPAAYFMDMHSKSFNMFEINQSNLELSNEKLVGMVERFSNQGPNEFEKFMELSLKYTDVLLNMADSYTL